MSPAPASEDWHPADIIAELRKKGWSLRQLSFAHGYKSNVLKDAMRKPYPKAEGIIAEAIGKAASVIWPSRYGPDGLPKHRRNSSTSSRAANVQKRRAA